MKENIMLLTYTVYVFGFVTIMQLLTGWMFKAKKVSLVQNDNYSSLADYDEGEHRLAA